MREIEHELETDPFSLPRPALRIRAGAEGRAQTRQLPTVYFDGEDLALARNGLELRIRRAGRSCRQSVKAEASERGARFDRWRRSRVSSRSEGPGCGREGRECREAREGGR